MTHPGVNPTKAATVLDEPSKEERQLIVQIEPDDKAGLLKDVLAENDGRLARDAAQECDDSIRGAHGASWSS
jgi:hypothetical protein